MISRFLIASSLIFGLWGCASSVKLSEAPVEDVKATAAQPAAPSATPSISPAAPGQSSVAAVKALPDTSMASGPSASSSVIYFDFDSYVVKQEFTGVIENHSKYIKAVPARRVVIEGHTDERGGREYNLALGQRRSEAVRKSLSLLGVPDGQMEAVSFGKEKPVAPGSDEESWAKNRRAQIVYRQ